jgi:hypothetical protein
MRSIRTFHEPNGMLWSLSTQEEIPFMKKTILFSIILLTVALAASAAPKKVLISLSAPTTVAGVELKAGDYQLVLSTDGSTVTFYRGSVEVLKAAVHAQTNGAKYSFTELDKSNDTLKEIHLAGTTTNVIIDGPAKSPATTVTR